MNRAVLVLAMTCVCATGAEHGATCDGQDVADQAGSKIPPLCIQGITASPKRYPPGLIEGVVWAWNKSKPIVRKIERAFRPQGRAWFVSLLHGR